MKINRCDCCGTETKDFIVIRFGADGFFIQLQPRRYVVNVRTNYIRSLGSF